MEKMLADADILITSFRDKALNKLGLDWESVHARHPHLVWAQMRGYGEYGPDKDTKGFDATAYAARGGWFACLPQAGEHYQPINWPAAMGDWNASLALIRRCSGCARSQRSHGRWRQSDRHFASCRFVAHANDAWRNSIWRHMAKITLQRNMPHQQHLPNQRWRMVHHLLWQL